MWVWWWLACSAQPTVSSPVSSPAVVAPQANAANQITVKNPRVRAMPPGTPSTAAYLELDNAGEAAVLVRARADVSGRVELHEHTADEDGVMQMRRITRIEIPAKGTVALEPGGLHLMLLGLKGDLEPGEAAEINLRFDDDSDLTVVAPVVDLRDEPLSE